MDKTSMGPETSSDPRILIVPAIALGSAVAVFGLIIYLNRAPEPTPLEIQAEQERELQINAEDRLALDEAPLIAGAKAAVLRTLRDPDSAEFGRVVVRYCKDLDCKEGDPSHGKPMVCGGVNAKNGFGGYTGFQVFIYGNGTLVPPDVTASQTALTAKICLD